MRRMMQIALISVLCLTSVAPAMAAGTGGTSTTGTRQTGTMTGTSNNNGYGNGFGNDFDYGTDNRVNGVGTLDVDNDNRNGLRARNYTGGNVRGFAANDAADGTDWGWLGLLGLLGLAGMFNRGRDNNKSKI